MVCRLDAGADREILLLAPLYGRQQHELSPGSLCCAPSWRAGHAAVGYRLHGRATFWLCGHAVGCPRCQWARPQPPTAELQTGPEGEQRGALLEHGGHLVVDGVHLGADGGEPILFLQVSHGKPRTRQSASQDPPRTPRSAGRSSRAGGCARKSPSCICGSALVALCGHPTAQSFVMLQTWPRAPRPPPRAPAAAPAAAPARQGSSPRP